MRSSERDRDRPVSRIPLRSRRRGRIAASDRPRISAHPRRPRYLEANWEQHWQPQPHSPTMRNHQGLNVQALDSRTSSPTATRSRYHACSGSPEPKIRRANTRMGSSLTLGTELGSFPPTTRPPPILGTHGAGGIRAQRLHVSDQRAHLTLISLFGQIGSACLQQRITARLIDIASLQHTDQRPVRPKNLRLINAWL
jgi:hypothetical protein